MAVGIALSFRSGTEGVAADQGTLAQAPRCSERIALASKVSLRCQAPGCCRAAGVIYVLVVADVSSARVKKRADWRGCAEMPGEARLRPPFAALDLLIQL